MSAKMASFPAQKKASFSTIPWSEAAEFGAPDFSRVGQYNYTGNNLDVAIAESEVSSVINDLGDAKQLAQTRSKDHDSSGSGIETALSFIGTRFNNAPDQVENIDFDLSPKEIFDDNNQSGTSGENTSQILGRKIRIKLRKTPSREEFLPINELDGLITRDVIREELRRYHKDAGLVDKIWEIGPKTTPVTTRRKIFATLALVDEISAIVDFINNDIYDSDLPFLFRGGKDDRLGTWNVYRKLKKPLGEPDEEVELHFFQAWKDYKLENFSNIQYQMLAPYFTLVSKDNPKVAHYNLDDDSTILPFIEDNIELDEPHEQYGGSADVRRIKIHPAHYNHCTSGDNSDNPPYAVKRLRSKDYSDFQNEVKALKRFSGENHNKHLINLLLTYQYRGRYHLLFDWADSNLLSYWKKKYPSADFPVRDYNFAQWVCKQWLGIVEGLQDIHTCLLHDSEDRNHGRHGDLKPENILWFKNPYFEKSLESLGAFVISDFGLTSFHRSMTKSQLNPENLGRSPTYRPPEYDVRTRVSQKCDLWSLGCVLLEFLIWYLYGWEGVQNFQTARVKEDNHEIPEDVFFNKTEKGVELKRSVAKTFERLRSHPRTTQFFLDILDMIENDLLRMRPTERVHCEKVVRSFLEFGRKCDSTQGNKYCMDPIFKPKRAATNLSELTATEPCLSKNHDGQSETAPVVGCEATIEDTSLITRGSGTSRKESVRPNSPKKVQFGGTDQVIPPRAHLLNHDSSVDMTYDSTETNVFGKSQNWEHASKKKQGGKIPESKETMEPCLDVRTTRSAMVGAKRAPRSWPLETRLINTIERGNHRSIEQTHSCKDSDTNGYIVATVCQAPKAEGVSGETTVRDSSTTPTIPLHNVYGTRTACEPMALNVRPSLSQELVLPLSGLSDDTDEGDDSLRPLLEGRSTSLNRSCEGSGCSWRGKWLREVFCCY